MARFLLLPNQPPHKGKNPRTGEELTYQPGQVIESDENLAEQDPERFAALKRFRLRPGVGSHTARDPRTGADVTYNADGSGAGAIVESHRDLAALEGEKYAAVDEDGGRPRPFSAGFGPAANPPPRPSPQNPDPPGSKHQPPPPGVEPGPAPTPTSLGSHAAVRQTPPPAAGPGQRQMQPTSAVPGQSSLPPSVLPAGFSPPPGNPAIPPQSQVRTEGQPGLGPQQGQQSQQQGPAEPRNVQGQPAYTRAELDKMTVNDLRALASQEDIDLAGVRTKDDIVNAILDAQEEAAD